MSELPVLVVDDSDFDRAMLVKAIAIKGQFKTLEAKSGEQCLELLQTRSIGIILLDIMMPGVHGTEALRKIREKFNPIELPIIMVTSKSEVNDVVSCLQNGANDYITKPINFEIAVSRISTHLRLAEASREMARLQEMAGLTAMIATYHHEINNPLTIAMGCLNAPDIRTAASRETLEKALWRIADIVKKIRSVTEQKEVEYQEYAGCGKMVKVK